MIQTSLEITSSFFWSSPWILTAPWTPVRLEILALWTKEAICLQAIEILESTIVSSASITPACSCFNNQPVNVWISYAFFFFTAVFVVSTAMHLVMVVAEVCFFLAGLLHAVKAFVSKLHCWKSERDDSEWELEKYWSFDEVAVLVIMVASVLDFVDVLSFSFLFSATHSSSWKMSSCIRYFI